MSNSSSSHPLEDGNDDGRNRATKRRKVDEPYRKRVAKACTSCRRLKEKCDGKTPCCRCVRHGRTCRSHSPSVRPQVSGTVTHSSELEERNVHLETIAAHFLGIVPTNIDSLRELVQGLQPQEKRRSDGFVSDIGSTNNLASTQASVFGRMQLSDPAFSLQLRDEVGRRLHESGVQSASEACSSESSYAPLSKSTFHRDNLPPKDVALFLCGVYFDFAQTTAAWIEQSWLEARLERLYSWAIELTQQDHPWICSVLVVMALGVQCAHLASQDVHSGTNSESFASISTYCEDHTCKLEQSAAELSTDALSVPSVESMQAIVLLANLALTNNKSVLADIYLDVAMRMSTLVDTQSHNQESDTSRERDATHQRLRQICFTWSRRICIFYGIPSSNVPTSFSSLSSSTTDVIQQQILPLARNDLFAQLTDWLMKLAEVTPGAIHNVEGHHASCVDALINIQASYKRWWSELAISRIPILQLNRYTAPLHISYYLNVIFIGRSFIFRSESDSSQPASVESQNAIAELVDDAEYSAYEVIDICSMLEKSTGLTASHFVEFGACQAAVLVMLAQSLIGRCHLFRGKLQQGLDLVRRISRRKAKVPSSIEDIAASVDRLAPHLSNQKYKSALSSCVDGDTSYKRFRSWAKNGSSKPSVDECDLEALVARPDDINALDEIFENPLLDPALFAFNPAGFNDEVGLKVY